MTTSASAPLVSVVLPTYNRPTSLRTAIESVAGQTYDRIELIVVDDHSNVPQREVVENAPHEGLETVVFVRHDENEGLSGARNTGIETASGQLIAFLDDDDYWSVDKIARQVELLGRSGPAVGGVYTGVRSVDADGNLINVRSVDVAGDITKALLYDTVVSIPTLLVRRSAIEEAGSFDERLRVYEDREWMLRLSEVCEFESIPDPLLTTRRDDDHESLTPDFETRRDLSHRIFLETARPIAADYGYAVERKATAYSSFTLGYVALSQGYYQEARQLLTKAVIRWPFVPKFYLYLLAAALGEPGYEAGRKAKRTAVRYLNRYGRS
ncbi:glycosyltransferase [Halococcus sp. AFM35]|uniref:glycosyltransferase n=1 Tax=Halococcus sp. AFM35 TaxID=3421653 RepID=UPI003EB8320D